jgi:hypothetical protein
VTRHCLALWVMALGCARGPEPCVGAATCPAGQECLADRCVVAGGQPVPQGVERRVLRPVEMAVLSHSRSGAELPTSVTFGCRAEGETLLLLRYAPTWAAGAGVESAFLLLYPLAGTGATLDDVPLDVWRIEESWTATRTTWLDRPSLGHPHSRGWARSAPPTTLRIDVTRFVRASTAPGRPNHGLAVVASAALPHGATFATGAGGGRTPELEVYLRTTPRER